jgi:hypothetical protein
MRGFTTKDEQLIMGVIAGARVTMDNYCRMAPSSAKRTISAEGGLDLPPLYTISAHPCIIYRKSVAISGPT